ncbi:MAG: OmpH family outer membrane protein [Blastocatellia bacterium]
MKRIMFLAVVMTFALSLTALAQTPAAPGAKPAAAQATGGTGAEGKIALINVAAFRNGVNELKVKLDSLNVEFEPRNKDLQAKNDEITALTNKINTQGPTVQPAVRNQWADELNQKQLVFKRAQEDLDALAKKRYEEITGPVYEKIGNFIEKYSQERGISVVFEGNALQQSQALVFAAVAMDITNDVMAEYNKANAGK